VLGQMVCIFQPVWSDPLRKHSLHLGSVGGGTYGF
jgi:hypothetical protein